MQFTDGETGFDAGNKTVYLNKDTQAPATDVGKLIGTGTKRTIAGGGQNAQDENRAAETQTPVYDRNTLSKLSDDELQKIHNEMTERYIENLPTGADGEKYRKEVNNSLTGRESMISSIVRQNGELNKGQINGVISETKGLSLKEIDGRITDKTAFTDNELQLLDEPALGKIMLRLAELNAQDMKRLGLPQNTETYIGEVGKIKNKPQMISTIRQIQTELKFAQKEITNTNSEKNMLKDNADDGTINQVQKTQTGNFGSNKTRFSYKPSSGAELVAAPWKTTMILGNYQKDMRSILAELNIEKSTNFEGAKDSFNVLNTPNELYKSPEQFWEEYNKPWLDKAIARGDAIILATEPIEEYLYKTDQITGQKVLTGFGKEYFYLTKERGYQFDKNTMMLIPKK